MRIFRPAVVLFVVLAGHTLLADTGVSELTIDMPEWIVGEPDELDYLDADLVLYAITEQGAHLGEASLGCGTDRGTMPRILGFHVYGTRPAELQDSFSLEAIQVRVDQGPERVAHAEVLDESPVFGPPVTRVLSFPLLYQDHRRLVDEMADGQSMTVEVSNVRPTLRFDLATARADIVVFRDTCEQIRARFDQSPFRWAFADEAHSTGNFFLRLYHEGNEPSVPEDVFRSPYVMVRCHHDRSRHGVDLVALVPPELHVASVRAGETNAISIQVDAGPVRRVALTADSSEDAHPASWSTLELPREEGPPMALLEWLRTGSAMTLEGIGAEPLRFNLAGGRQVISEFADACINLPVPEPSDETAGYAQSLIEQRARLSSQGSGNGPDPAAHSSNPDARSLRSRSSLACSVWTFSQALRLYSW